MTPFTALYWHIGATAMRSRSVTLLRAKRVSAWLIVGASPAGLGAGSCCCGRDTSLAPRGGAKKTGRAGAAKTPSRGTCAPRVIFSAPHFCFCQRATTQPARDLADAPIPIFLITCDRLTATQQTIASFYRGVHHLIEIVIHDNASSYPPFLPYLDELEAQGVRGVRNQKRAPHAEMLNDVRATVNAWYRGHDAPRLRGHQPGYRARVWTRRHPAV